VLYPVGTCKPSEHTKNDGKSMGKTSRNGGTSQCLIGRKHYKWWTITMFNWKKTS
jgi:hypothetical protein